MSKVTSQIKKVRVDNLVPIEKIIETAKNLKEDAAYRISRTKNPQKKRQETYASELWGSIEHYLLQVKALEHHKVSTCGLWATDRLELIGDPYNVLFQIKYEEQNQTSQNKTMAVVDEMDLSEG